jgi:mono/diheme cytochrome c family protein
MIDARALEYTGRMIFRTILLALVVSLPLRAAEKDTLTLVVGGKEIKYSLAELRKQLKVVTVTLDDPVYKAKKTFDGFALADVLALGGLRPGDGGDEIVFTAKDGYSPNAPFSAVKDHGGVLAFQEHGTQKQFGRVAQGKAMVSPAPYYVVWGEGRDLGEKVPWPYQLVRIEVVNFTERYGKLFPKGASEPVMKGFLTFKNQCIRCHSLNLQGGDVGPELNVPKNVTEYWDKGTLRQFIRDASSFRAKDKMPVFTSLRDDELDGVIEYFTYMKDHKQL